MQLSELSDIHSGHTARGKLDPVQEGGVPALQLGDIGTTGKMPGTGFQRYHMNKLSDRYFVRGGEVVFRSRGEPNVAAAIPDPLPEPVVVIIPLLIVRPDRSRVLPEYVAWAINQPDAQRQLGAKAQGTSLRTIPKTVLENLEIAVPDLPTQKSIVELNALARQEGQLLRHLAVRRENLLSAILGEAAKAADQKEIAR